MFEVMISSLDDKFRRVDTIERAVHMIMRHMEIMDARIQKSNNISASLLHKLEAMERRMTVCSGSSSASPPISARGLNTDTLQRHLSDVDTHVSRLQRTLDGLEISMVAGSVQRNSSSSHSSRSNDAASTPITTKNNRRRETVGTVTRDRRPLATESTERQQTPEMSASVNKLNDHLVSMDNTWRSRMDDMTENLSHISTQMATISSALLETDQTSQENSQSRSQLDVLIDKIDPLVDVSSKMDEVWNVVVGTKSSVDDLVPKSELLLHTSNRQERAINSIQNDLHTTTRKIIANIGMVEKKLRQQAESERPTTTTQSFSPNPRYQRHKEQLRASGSALFGRTAETSKRLIRPATLPSGLFASTQSAADNNDREAPFDLLDKEFLEKFSNYSTSTTTQNPALNVEDRGKPEGIVYPGRPTVKESTFAYLEIIPANENIGIKDAYSCDDYREKGMNQSGIYYIRIDGTTYWYLKVFCEMEQDGGGWTIIQRRGDYPEDQQHNFNQPWENYKQGFGDPTRDFWLGNENIFMLTNMERYELRVEVEDFDGERRYAKYDNFKIHGEADDYKLEIDGYSGTAGDSMNDPWYGSNLSPFSTFDRDNDRSSLNCANMLKGGWWWRSCGRGLNGLYLSDPHDAIARQGIVWYRWRGWDYSLRRSVMMIRPYRQ